MNLLSIIDFRLFLASRREVRTNETTEIIFLLAFRLHFFVYFLAKWIVHFDPTIEKTRKMLFILYLIFRGGKYI